MRYFVKLRGAEVEVELGPTRDGRTSGRIVRRDAQGVELARGPDHALELRPIDDLARLAVAVDRDCHDVMHEPGAASASVTIDGVRHVVTIEDERERAAHLAAGSAPKGPVVVRSAMPGIVRAVLVEAGQIVVAGQPLVILEAMKMENEIRAEHAGIVRELKIAAGTAVDGGVALVVLDPPLAG